MKLRKYLKSFYLTGIFEIQGKYKPFFQGNETRKVVRQKTGLPGEKNKQKPRKAKGNVQSNQFSATPKFETFKMTTLST